MIVSNDDGRVIRDPPEHVFTDYRLGDVVLTRGRTIEAADISAFAGLVGNYYPLHVDAQYAATTRFGSRVAHGSLVYSIAVGLVELSGYYGDAIEAMLRVTDLEAKKPVLPGDTVRVRATVTDLTPSRSGAAAGGRMTVHYSVQNQRGDEVLSFVQTMLVRGERP